MPAVVGMSEEILMSIVVVLEDRFFVSKLEGGENLFPPPLLGGGVWGAFRCPPRVCVWWWCGSVVGRAPPASPPGWLVASFSGKKQKCRHHFLIRSGIAGLHSDCAGQEERQGPQGEVPSLPE